LALTPVAAWGGPDTPFQLAGQAPIGRSSADGRLWDHAGGLCGFYGYLRIANARVVRRVGVGLLDLGDRCWRDDYDGQAFHPCEAADDAIAKEAADMGCEL